MIDESLSALLDGECSPEELDQLLTRMDRDPALRERFGKMVLAQHVRRDVLARRSVPADFADRVMAALPERPDPVVVPWPRRIPWPPAAGLAAAAALGAVAVLALKPDVPTAPAADVTAATPPADDAAVAQLDDESARQLRNYLMAYSQSRGQQGMGGTLGYARYAAYTADGDADESGGSR